MERPSRQDQEHVPPPEPRVDPDPEAVITTCPNCNARLEVVRCKLVCLRCHYFMSCAEYV